MKDVYEISGRLPRGSVNLSADEKAVVILDQTALPNRTVWLSLREEPELVEAIFELRVRGAPAIGIMAAYSLYVLARQIETSDRAAFQAQLEAHAEALNRSRPTAVNLSWALGRLKAAVAGENSVAAAVDRLKEESYRIHEEDIGMCRAIAQHGLSLLQDGDTVITHCNAGPLATSQYGTALGPILLAKEQGLDIRAYADETRPLLQGARLTSYELEKAGVDVTLICDSMAAIVMSQGKIQACLVGCDRVAANGDAANKIGTYGLAILASHFDIPFYVLGPTSTIDLASRTGADIVIEEREGKEIKEKWYKEAMALPETKCYNPAFDVTPHELITAIVTEKKVLYPPYTASIASLFD